MNYIYLITGMLLSFLIFVAALVMNRFDVKKTLTKLIYLIMLLCAIFMIGFLLALGLRFIELL